MSANFIQSVQNCHINSIIDIEQESYRNPWTRDHFKNDVNHNNSINYIYIVNNELKGYLFGYLFKDEYHLNKITVKKEFRQRRIGKLLFLHCFKELLNKDVKCIQLEVSSLNLTAQKFYKDLNFTQDGLRRDYYSENEHALLYTLRLK